jgi:HD-GYP domain-containing protein (c-di-GMP phosphodiesterase class II)
MNIKNSVRRGEGLELCRAGEQGARPHPISQVTDKTGKNGRLNNLSQDGMARDAVGNQQPNHERILGGTIAALSYMVELRDPYTSRHQMRVAGISTAIAARLNWPRERRKYLHWAAQLHDLGKICVPTDILNKPTKLSKAEFELVKQHPAAGYRVLAYVELPPVVAEAVYQHHERLDGSGYPRGLRGDDVNVEARIIAVADVLEAMTLHRPYRAARGMEEALAELRRGSGTKYDPGVVQIAIDLFVENKLNLAATNDGAIAN